MPTESLYEGFRYYWAGGELPAGIRPTETVVAEILGPGGKAQIFADGHSIWKRRLSAGPSRTGASSADCLQIRS